MMLEIICIDKSLLTFFGKYFEFQISNKVTKRQTYFKSSNFGNGCFEEVVV